MTGTPYTPGVIASLVDPAERIRELNSARPVPVPLSTWAGLVVIAVAGSLLYGASLVRLFPTLQLQSSALYFTLSAGLAWCLFIPALVAGTQRSLAVVAQVCLVSMTYGEAVLLSGALLNLLGMMTGPPTMQVGVTVAMSNVVMAATLAFQLLAAGVPVWRSLAL